MVNRPPPLYDRQQPTVLRELQSLNRKVAGAIVGMAVNVALLSYIAYKLAAW